MREHFSCGSFDQVLYAQQVSVSGVGHLEDVLGAADNRNVAGRAFQQVRKVAGCHSHSFTSRHTTGDLVAATHAAASIRVS